MQGKYVSIKLNPDDRLELEKFSTKGAHNVRLVNRAKIILTLDETKEPKKETHHQIANRLGISYQTIAITKKDFLAAQNISEFLQRKKRTTPPTQPRHGRRLNGI